MMNIQAEASFKIDSWEEAIYKEFDGGRNFSRASVKKTFKGDIHGEGTLEYLMAYTADGNASFVGMELFNGGFGKLIGSFIMQHAGTFAGGISTVTLSIVPGSATGELDGLRGEGGFATGHAEEYPFTLDYYFEGNSQSTLRANLTQVASLVRMKVTSKPAQGYGAGLRGLTKLNVECRSSASAYAPHRLRILSEGQARALRTPNVLTFSRYNQVKKICNQLRFYSAPIYALSRIHCMFAIGASIAPISSIDLFRNPCAN